jgi:hypothetical protein
LKNVYLEARKGDGGCNSHGSEREWLQGWEIAGADVGPCTAILFMWRTLSTRSGEYEEIYLLGYNAVWTIENKRTFRRNIPPFFQGRRVNQPINSCCNYIKQSFACYLLVANFLQVYKWSVNPFANPNPVHSHTP